MAAVSAQVKAAPVAEARSAALAPVQLRPFAGAAVAYNRSHPLPRAHPDAPDTSGRSGLRAASIPHPMIPNDFIQTCSRRVDIVDVIDRSCR